MDPLELAAATSQTLALNRRRHWSPTRARFCRNLAAPPLARLHKPPPELRIVVRTFTGHLPLSLSLPCMPVRSPSPCRATSPSNVPSATSRLRADPALAFPVSCSRSQADPRLNPSPGRPFSAKSGDRAAASSPPAQCAAAPFAPFHPSRSILIQRPRLDLTRGQQIQYRSTEPLLRKSPYVLWK